MDINDNTIIILKKMKENLDHYWDLIPEESKLDNRFGPRELRFSRYKTEELEFYLVIENSFIAMCKQFFHLDNVSLAEAYDLVENLSKQEIR